MSALDAGVLDELSADVPSDPIPLSSSSGSERREREKRRKLREKKARKRAAIAQQAPF